MTTALAGSPLADDPLAGGSTASWRSLLEDAARRLGDRQAARFLVEEVSGRSWAALVGGLDAVAPDPARRRLEALLVRRLSGEPLQHVLGSWSFAGVELTVDRRALIPRPETEVVVEVALAELARRPSPGRTRASLDRTRQPSARNRPPGNRPTQLALDLGTGSGAIACALVAARPELQVVAVDRSVPALQLAAENRLRLLPEDGERLSFRQGSWYEPLGDLAGAVDLVVANPPYLAANEWDGLDPVVRDHDPVEALVSGPTGLEAIAAVIEGAPGVLAPDGALVVEIAPHQRADALALALGAGAETAEVLADLAGRARVLRARW